MRHPAPRRGPVGGLLSAGLLGLLVPGMAAAQSLPARPDMLCARADAFAARDWQPPPPPLPKPPPPKAPPLPFRFLGQVEEAGGKPTAYLAWENRVINARAGLVIDDRYRVDAVEAGRVAFTYLPLQEKQVLPTGTFK